MIKRSVVLLCLLLLCGCGLVKKGPQSYEKVIEPEEVPQGIALDNLRAETPARWMELVPEGPLEHAVFVLPSVSGSKPKLTITKEPLTIIDADYLKATAPESWAKENPPPGGLRAAQFRLPRAEGDSRDAEVRIFANLGGTAEENVERWKGQFKKVESSEVKDLEVPIGKAVRLEVEGTFLDKPRPNAPDQEAKELPNYKMVGLHVESGTATTHVKLIGPRKTVDKHVEELEKWIAPLKDVKETTIKEGKLKGATRVDLLGHPSYSLVCVHFTGPRNSYLLKLVGSEKAIEKSLPDFENWLRSFK